jgi:hypothetical protein
LSVPCGAFPRRGETGETIEISRHLWFGICTGACPDYSVIVRPDGRVWVVRRYFDAVDEIRRFRISRARAARFREILAPYYPDDDTTEPSECRHDVPPGEESLVSKVVEMEVKWKSAAGSAHLIGCDTSEYGALREAIGGALESLGLAVNARPSE